MHGLRIAPLLILFTLMITTSSCDESDFNLGDVEKFQLENGLVAIIGQQPLARRTVIRTGIRVGSVDEPKAHTGLAHLFEHMMFKGTKDYPAGYFDQVMAKLGAESNAYTTYGRTVYHEIVADEGLEEVLKLETSRLRNLQINQELLDTERQVVREERRVRRDNSPSGRLFEEFFIQMYGKEHPLGWPIIGWHEHVEGATPMDCQKFYDQWYQPENATLVILSSKPKSEVKELVKKYYGAIPSGPKTSFANPRVPPLTGKLGRSIVQEDGQVSMPEILLGWPVVGEEDNESSLYALLELMLFSGRLSLLQQNLVFQKKLASEMGGGISTAPGSSTFFIKATPFANVKPDLLIEEIQKLLMPENLTESLLDLARNQLLVQTFEQVRRSDQLAELLLLGQMVNGNHLDFINEIKRLRRVKLGDIRDLLSKNLTSSRRLAITLTPKLKSQARGKR